MSVTSSLPIYLDYAATTPVDPHVANKMALYLTQEGVFGNPSSLHPIGLAARRAVDVAREQVADIIHAEANEIIWTSGATEANNLAIKGAASLYQRKGKHIVTVKTEHPSVLETCQQLEKEGYQVTYLTPNTSGLIEIDALRDALRDNTVLVSVMHVNNEIGVIQDIASIAALTAEREILLHVDAAQSVGKLAIDVQQMPVDLLSFCAHKIYGPKGIGALYMRKKPRVRVRAQLHGGGQESGMRAGTLATHQIVGMGEALRLAKENRQRDEAHCRRLRQLLLDGVKASSRVYVNGDVARSIPSIVNLRVAGMTAKEVIAALPELAISSGSACHAGEIGSSYVLRALGQTEEEAASAVRFSFGRFVSEEEMAFAVLKFNQILLSS